ncbi:helix-turn-helix domain-containing protein [Mycobacterium sp. 134]|uniref:helix-turn-helix domain-containing protein n=1 Tax=Mycobacterium sp. 134 TaxID=3400425 RepID=UPI003AACB3C1
MAEGSANNEQPAHGDGYPQAQTPPAGHTNYEPATAQASETGHPSDVNDDIPPPTPLEPAYLSQRMHTARSAAHAGESKQRVDEFKRLHKHEAQVRQVITALKNARRRRNMTIAQVAEIAGVDKSVISRFENETTDTRLSTLLRYAEAVDTEVTFNVGGARVPVHEIDREKLQEYAERMASYAEKLGSQRLRIRQPRAKDNPSLVDAVSYVIVSYIGETVRDATGTARDESYAHNLAVHLVDVYHAARHSTDWFNEVLAGSLPAKSRFIAAIRQTITTDLGDTVEDPNEITLHEYAYHLAPYVVDEILRHHNTNTGKGG